MRTWVIVNPAAGAGRAGREWPALAARLRAAGSDFTACVTCGPGDAIGCARGAVAAGATTVVVVGGDGTVNEAVDGLLANDLPAEGRPALAHLPIGTGTDFARGLGIGAGDQAIATLVGGETRAIDAGLAVFSDDAGRRRSRHFVNIADFGLGPITSAQIARGPKGLGPTAYFYGALRAIAAHAPPIVRVTVDGALAYAGPSGLVAVANGPAFGGGMRVAPKARHDDGAFDVVILGDVTRRALVTTLLPRVYRGAHLRHPLVHLRRGAEIAIEADGALPLETDGEIVGRAPARFTLLPRALRVVVPGAQAADRRR